MALTVRHGEQEHILQCCQQWSHSVAGKDVLCGEPNASPPAADCLRCAPPKQGGPFVQPPSRSAGCDVKMGMAGWTVLVITASIIALKYPRALCMLLRAK